MKYKTYETKKEIENKCLKHMSILDMFKNLNALETSIKAHGCKEATDAIEEFSDAIHDTKSSIVYALTHNLPASFMETIEWRTAFILASNKLKNDAKLFSSKLKDDNLLDKPLEENARINDRLEEYHNVSAQDTSANYNPFVIELKHMKEARPLLHRISMTKEQGVIEMIKGLQASAEAMANSNKGFTKQSNQFRQFRTAVEALRDELSANGLTAKNNEKVSKLLGMTYVCAQRYKTHCLKHPKEGNATRNTRDQLVENTKCFIKTFISDYADEREVKKNTSAFNYVSTDETEMESIVQSVKNEAKSLARSGNANSFMSGLSSEKLFSVAEPAMI